MLNTSGRQGEGMGRTGWRVEMQLPLEGQVQCRARSKEPRDSSRVRNSFIESQSGPDARVLSSSRTGMGPGAGPRTPGFPPGSGVEARHVHD